MTDKQIKFIAEYSRDFNATQAAIRAGYSKKTAYSIGQELLNKPEVQSFMRENRSKLIADRAERLKFWSNTMRDSNEDMRYRLKASELLARSCADFIERQEIVTHQNSLYDLSKLNKEELLQLRELLVKATPKKEGEVDKIC